MLKILGVGNPNSNIVEAVILEMILGYFTMIFGLVLAG